ncbi:MAG: prolyl oligopeptidase family serine peptidase [Bacteroidota bacterium]
MSKNIILIYFILFLYACRTENIETDTPQKEVSQSNVSYGTDPKQAMDIYLPAGRKASETPFLVLIHGGGWTSGDRSDFKSIVDTIKTRLPGYAVFNISYRLAANGQNLFPTQENDVKAALNFIFSNLTEYKISDRFALIGASAGGHLALLNAYKESATRKAKAVVSFFGPTDLVQFYNNPPSLLVPLVLQSVTGFTPANNLSLYQSSSPTTYAVQGSSPTLLIHGGADQVVPPSQSVLLKDKLSGLNVPHQYVFYPNGGHGDWDAATYKDAFNQLQAFLLKHMP